LNEYFSSALKGAKALIDEIIRLAETEGVRASELIIDNTFMPTAQFSWSSDWAVFNSVNKSKPKDLQLLQIQFCSIAQPVVGIAMERELVKHILFDNWGGA